MPGPLISFRDETAAKQSIMSNLPSLHLELVLRTFIYVFDKIIKTGFLLFKNERMAK